MQNLENINITATLVLSYFNITVEELDLLSNMSMVSGRHDLAEKITNLINNIGPSITIEEETESSQLPLFSDSEINY